jgi:hypothetical protein
MHKMFFMLTGFIAVPHLVADLIVPRFAIVADCEGIVETPQPGASGRTP